MVVASRQFGVAVVEAEGAPEPAVLFAVTDMLYATSLISPLIVQEVAGATAVQVRVGWPAAAAFAE